jgi:FkbM family methyltransferase
MINAKLQQEFQAILERYAPIEAGRAASAVDGFFAYRILLGRMPNVDAELGGLLDHGRTWREFLADLLASAEYRNRLGFLPSGLRLMSEVNGFKFWFDSEDREMGAVMACGVYEPQTVRLISRLVEPGMVCLDIGAQTGFYTCHMARIVGDLGCVHAFEPVDRSFSLLERNVRDNGWADRTFLHHVACSEKSGEIQVGMAAGMVVAGAGDETRVRALRIDDLCIERAAFCKLDVEGFEPQVIAGMMELIRRALPILVTEANEYWLTRAGSSSAGYSALLRSLGYRLFDIDSDLAEFEPTEGIDQLANTNLLAIPAARCLDVLATLRS